MHRLISTLTILALTLGLIWGLASQNAWAQGGQKPASVQGVTHYSLNLYGIQPGMSQQDVRAKLGIPMFERRKTNAWEYRNKGGMRGQADPNIFFNQDKKVAWLMGSQLNVVTANGQASAFKSSDSFKGLQTKLGTPSACSQPDKNGAVVKTYKPYKLSVVCRGDSIVVFALGRDD